MFFFKLGLDGAGRVLLMDREAFRGYALALTTARYYTPSGRSIQRDYGSTAFEDYVAPKDRKTCDEARGGEAKLTDAGRKVFGEGEARRRSLVWDPQVKKGLELVPKSELLLKNPQQFIAERVAQAQPRPATTGNPQ